MSSSDKSYIYLDRSLFHHELWTREQFTKGQAWVDMLFLAAHTDTTMLIRGIEITLKRGQMAASEAYLMRRWKWSKNKTRRFMAALRDRGQIVQQKSNVITITTLLNYDRRQTKRTAKRTAEGPQKDQNKEFKEIKSKKPLKPLSGSTAEPNGIYQDVITYLNRKAGKRFSPKTAATQKAINGRIADGHTLDDFKKVINVKTAEWKDTEYDKHLCPDTLFRPSNFEKYLNQKPESELKVIRGRKDNGKYTVEY